MKHVLLIRFSALGDVAILAKILNEYELNGAKAVILTKPHFGALFDIEKYEVPIVDFKGKHKGLTGLIKLKKELSDKYNVTEVLDLHNTLRAKILKILFRLNGTKTITIDKGKKEKKKLTRRRNKIKRQLKTSKERYLEVLNSSGLLTLAPKGSTETNSNNPKTIGIAPFAAHPTKQYPLEKTEKLIEKLDKNNFEIKIFGGGEKEKILAEKWENKYKNVESLIGKFKLADELKQMHKTCLMVTMDSGNMHLAALTGTQIVALWGATHPFAGFAADTEKKIDIQLNLSCRPCSVFGQKKCYMKNHACMNLIDVDVVYKKILELASNCKQY